MDPDPDGGNGLLTGDIGSGKSTLVDAVTTLLVPSHRTAYNKAAGAEAGKDRAFLCSGPLQVGTQRSSGNAKPVSLRDHNSYSVILGVFHNAGYDQTVTLAQVFWMKEPRASRRGSSSAPSGSCRCRRLRPVRNRYHGVAQEAARPRSRGLDSFPKYGAWFRRRFGIENDQALELFHQTVSMKSVGNLTDFVRGHMLEPFEWPPHRGPDRPFRGPQPRSRGSGQSQAANGASHAAHRRLRSIRKLLHQVEGLRACREALRYYAAAETGLARQTHRRADADWEGKTLRSGGWRPGATTSAWRKANSSATSLRTAATVWSGSTPKSARRNRVRDSQTQGAAPRRTGARVGEHPAEDEPRSSRCAACPVMVGPLGKQKIASERSDRTRRQPASGKTGADALTAEIDSLKSRRSNIPAEQVAMRAALCKALDYPRRSSRSPANCTGARRRARVGRRGRTAVA